MCCARAYSAARCLLGPAATPTDAPKLRSKNASQLAPMTPSTVAASDSPAARSPPRDADRGRGCRGTTRAWAGSPARRRCPRRSRRPWSSGPRASIPRRCRAGPGKDPSRSRRPCRPDQIDSARRHVAPRLQACRRCRPLQVVRIGREAEHPAALAERSAGARPTCCAAPGASSPGLAWVMAMGRLECSIAWQGGTLARMAHVDHEADAVHLGDHLAAHTGQAGVVLLVAARGQQRLVVVAELHEAQAERVEDLHEADVVLYAGRVLRAEDDGRAPRLLGAASVTSAAVRAWTIRSGKRLEPAGSSARR